MNRSAIIIRKSKDGSRCIAVDEANANEILSFVEQDKRYLKKFNFICELILGNHVNRELYDKEEINNKARGVTAMKLFKGQENARIYCKEIESSGSTFIVIAVTVLPRKKQTVLTHKEKSIINRIAQYEYTSIK